MRWWLYVLVLKSTAFCAAVYGALIKFKTKLRKEAFYVLCCYIFASLRFTVTSCTWVKQKWNQTLTKHFCLGGSVCSCLCPSCPSWPSCPSCLCNHVVSVRWPIGDQNSKNKSHFNCEEEEAVSWNKNTDAIFPSCGRGLPAGIRKVKIPPVLMWTQLHV